MRSRDREYKVDSRGTIADWQKGPRADNRTGGDLVSGSIGPHLGILLIGSKLVSNLYYCALSGPNDS